MRLTPRLRSPSLHRTRKLQLPDQQTPQYLRLFLPPQFPLSRQRLRSWLFLPRPPLEAVAAQQTQNMTATSFAADRSTIPSSALAMNSTSGGRLSIQEPETCAQERMSNIR